MPGALQAAAAAAIAIDIAILEASQPQSQYNYPPGYRIQRKLREQTPSNLRLCASLTRDACLTRRAGPL